MARLGGHGRAKYTTGTRLGTSDGRGWAGLLAERWRHSEGRSRRGRGSRHRNHRHAPGRAAGQAARRRPAAALRGRAGHDLALPRRRARGHDPSLRRDPREHPSVPARGAAVGNRAEGNRPRPGHRRAALRRRVSRSADRADRAGDPRRDDRSGAGGKDAGRNPGRGARRSRPQASFQPWSRRQSRCRRRAARSIPGVSGG